MLESPVNCRSRRIFDVVAALVRGVFPRAAATRNVCRIGSGTFPFEAVMSRGMRARAYVETSVPSFYFEARCESEMLARRDWTRSWWNAAIKTTALTTSIAVVDELRRGEFPSRASCLELIARLPILAIDTAVLEIVAAYISHRVTPPEPVGDALHLALASYHHCDFLVTWNCAHLANANKFGHIRRVNSLLGLMTPAQVTPLELLGDADEDRSSY